MSFEDWNAFRQGEIVRDVKLVCCECCGPAEGNVSFNETKEELCDSCAEQDELAADRDREEAANEAYHFSGEDMDGDHESGLASAGFGTDEDYGDYSGGGEDW